MKENILYLRSKGKTYDEIEKILGCSSATIAYHLNEAYKGRVLKRNNASRIKRLETIKQEFGAKCEICAYNKCLNALDFHHKNKNEKIKAVSILIRSGSMNRVREEAKKCQLICANCHRELHSKENRIILPVPHVSSK